MEVGAVEDFEIISNDTEGHEMLGVFSNTNEVATLFSGGGRKGRVINLAANNIPPGETEQRADVSGGACGKGALSLA